MTSQNQARLQLVFAALLFSTGGAAIKASTLTGWQVASFRSGVAAVTLLLLVPATRRGWGWRPALLGIAYAATLILFVTANKLATSANTIFLQATSPVYLLLLGPLFLKEPVRPRDFWVVAAVLAGLVLFFIGNESPVVTAPDPAKGNLLALMSGVSFAVTIAGLRVLRKDATEFGVIDADADGKVRGFLEKPAFHSRVFVTWFVPAATPCVALVAGWATSERSNLDVRLIR